MAQEAKPQPDATNQNPISRDRAPRGNPRIGPGQGGTDQAVVARLPYTPPTQGETKDSRFRSGPR